MQTGWVRWIEEKNLVVNNRRQFFVFSHIYVGSAASSLTSAFQLALVVSSLHAPGPTTPAAVDSPHTSDAPFTDAESTTPGVQAWCKNTWCYCSCINRLCIVNHSPFPIFGRRRSPGDRRRNGADVVGDGDW
ncbi:hypothetical protein C0Q70_02753 [Pomacea canaliculata]|uniref:Uncharacterized protein n=1 Tax=Pomacea canaliculata TaxID=400727 RepID=A0A2T7PQT9_POMCA|nr:hypothetical protein C0Q70_02753 [Pomacea canaliculata]